MLPDFALHHLPLYSVAIGCAAGLALWVRVRWTLARQTQEERRDAIANRALASSMQRRMGPLDELAMEPVTTARRRVR